MLTLAGAVVLGPIARSEDLGNDRNAYVEWARRSLTPVPVTQTAPGTGSHSLSPLGQIIADARIVALSEGVHDAAEPLDFRNELLRYLVEEKGFTAIAIESGIVESRLVHDYVLGGPGDLSAVLAGGISWTFDNLPQNADLVSWLRQYNADPRHPRKVSFYGFDIPGSPGNPDPNRGPEAALLEALGYLAHVDAPAAGLFHERLDRYLPRLRVDFSRPGDRSGYEGFTPAERDVLTSAIEDLITLLERHEREYSIASSPGDYQWAYRAAIGARQVDEWLRQLPPGARSFEDVIPYFGRADNVRDRAQADNLEWVLRQEGPRGKVLVFAHSIHLSMNPVTTRWWGAGDGTQATLLQTYQYDVTGTYLRRRLGEQLITIGNLVRQGQVGCADYKEKLTEVPPQSVVSISGEIGTSAFILDLRTAPQRVAAWLDTPRPFGQADEVFGLHEAFDVTVGSSFDLLFYLDAVTPACPVNEPVHTASSNSRTGGQK